MTYFSRIKTMPTVFLQLETVKKANPYHDEKGRFSSHEGSAFVSTTGVFSKFKFPKATLKANPLDLAKEKYKELRTSDISALASDSRKKFNALTKSQQEFLKEYSGPGYGLVNSVLRGKSSYGSLEESPPGIQDAVKNIDSVMKESTIPENMYLYRGMSGSAAKHVLDAVRDKSLVGTVLKEDGFMSSSVDIKQARKFSNKVVLQIKAPKGTPGFYLGPKSESPSEKEMLLDRGHSLVITGHILGQVPGEIIVNAVLMPK